MTKVWGPRSKVMAKGNETLRIFLSAGEASGEQYAVQLMQAIWREQPAAEFFGLGGRRMEALGFERVVRAEDVAVMGITEILRHVPYIYREYCRLRASLSDGARGRRPDVAVLIDFPDVNLGLARTCKRLGIPVIFFVSPQVWAWKKYRLRQIRKNVDRMLVIFPFEESFYRTRGVDATFIGHPLSELPLPAQSRAAFALEHSLDPAKQWIGLLPGSRPREIALNLAGMVGAATLLAQESAYEWLLPVAPTLKVEHVASLREQLRALGAVIADSTSPKGGATARTSQAEPRVTLVSDARAALYHARASVVASGTATVEAALLGNPFLVVYRVSALTYAIARRVVTVPHVAMVNLVAGRRAVPELIQQDFTPVKVASALRTLLNDDQARQTMQIELERVAGLLASSGAGAIASVATATLAAAATSIHTRPSVLS